MVGQGIEIAPKEYPPPNKNSPYQNDKGCRQGLAPPPDHRKIPAIVVEDANNGKYNYICAKNS